MRTIPTGFATRTKSGCSSHRRHHRCCDCAGNDSQWGGQRDSVVRSLSSAVADQRCRRNRTKGDTHTTKKKNHEGCPTKKGGCDTDAVSLLPCTSRSSPSTHHPTTCSLTQAPPTSSPQNPQSRNKRNTSAGRQARILSLVARPLNKKERQRPAVFFSFFSFSWEKKHTYTQVCA